MLRLMLGHHPEICRCDEMEYFLPGIELELAGKPVSAYIEYLKYDRIFQLYGYAINETGSFRSLAADIFQQLADKDGRRILGGTIHNDFALLTEIWPNCKYIFLDRDPRDVARSVIAMGWAGTAWKASDFWSRAKQNWQSVCAIVPESNRLELKFEELVSEPVAVLNQVCQFLGIEYTPEMLRIDANTTYNPPSKSEAASWEKKTNPRDVAEVETSIGKPLIQAAGYKVSDYPPIATGGLASLKLLLREKHGKLKFQWRRFGFGLWCLRFIADKTGSGALHRFVAPRVNYIENQHLK